MGDERGGACDLHSIHRKSHFFFVTNFFSDHDEVMAQEIGGQSEEHISREKSWSDNFFSFRTCSAEASRSLNVTSQIKSCVRYVVVRLFIE